MSAARFLLALVCFAGPVPVPAATSDTTPPAIVLVTPPPASSPTNLTQITVTFSEPVLGVTADDLIINGLAATGVTGSNAMYTFTFLPPPYGGVTVGWAAAHGITDLA